MRQLGFNENHPYAFVSYKREDRHIVEADIKAFQNLYNFNIWYDELLTAGQGWDSIASTQLIGCDLIIFYASTEAIASLNVQKEITLALDLGKKILPINFYNKHFLAGFQDDFQSHEKRLKLTDASKFDTLEAIKLIKSCLHNTITYVHRSKDSANFDFDYYYSKIHETVKALSPGIIMPAEHGTGSIYESQAAANSGVANTTDHGGAAQIIEDTDATKAPTKPTVLFPDSFSIYGEACEGLNQAHAMAKIFEAVLNKHSNKFDEVFDKINLLSLSPESRRGWMYSTKQIEVCGRKVWVDTQLGTHSKATAIATLFDIVDESLDVLVGFDLPKPKKNKKASGGKAATPFDMAAESADVLVESDPPQSSEPDKDSGGEHVVGKAGGKGDFMLFGERYSEKNAANMMAKSFEVILNKHPSVLEVAINEKNFKYLSIGKVREDSKVYFEGATRTFMIGEHEVYLGTSFGNEAKVKNIHKLLELAGEDKEVFKFPLKADQ